MAGVAKRDNRQNLRISEIGIFQVLRFRRFHALPRLPRVFTAAFAFCHACHAFARRFPRLPRFRRAVPLDGLQMLARFSTTLTTFCACPDTGPGEGHSAVALVAEGCSRTAVRPGLQGVVPLVAQDSARNERRGRGSTRCGPRRASSSPSPSWPSSS